MRATYERERTLMGEDPTYWQLVNLVAHEPQIDPFGQVRWLLYGGWAVELTAREILNEPRRHSDIDVIPLRRTKIDWNAYNVDTYPLRNALGGRPLNRRHLEQTALTVPLRDSGHSILVVNPAYLAVHRLEDDYEVDGLPGRVFPRPSQDFSEGAVVLRARAQHEPHPALWNNALQDALEVLPPHRRRATRARIRDVQRGILQPPQRRLALAA